jgi:hypothetical protein
MLSQGADGLKKMMEEGVKLSGWTKEGVSQADKLGDSFTKLKTSMSGAFNTIASSLAPAVEGLVNKISDIIVKVRDWANEHPGLTKNLSSFVAILGLALTSVGGLLLVIPKIVTSFTAFNAILVKAKISAEAFWSALLLIPIAIEAIIAVYNKLDSQWSKDVLEPQEIGWAKIEQGMKRADGTLQKYSDTTKVYSQAQAQYYQSLGYSVELYTGKVEQSAEDQVKAIENVTREQKELEWVTKALQKASESQSKIAQKNYNLASKLLDLEYNKKLKLLGLDETAETKALQDKIDALDAQTKAEEQALEDQQYINDRANLVELQNNAETAKDRKKYNEQILELDAQHQRVILLRNRDNQIAALQDEIEKVRDSYETKREELQTWYDNEKTILDTALEEELTRIEDVTAKLEEEYGIREIDTEIHIAKLQEIIDKLKDKTITITTWYKTIGEGKNGSSEADNLAIYDELMNDYVTKQGNSQPQDSKDTQSPPIGTNNYLEDLKRLQGYAQGGIVSRPTLAFVGEGGEKEAIIPEHDWSNMGGVTVNFTEPIFMEREDQMYKFADILYKQMNRKNRLQFGTV